MPVADEAGMRAAHHAHLEQRCVTLADQLAAAHAQVALLEARIENLIAALAVRDGVPVAAARLRWTPPPQKTSMTVIGA